MYPSKFPVIYILQLLIIGAVIGGSIYFGVVHLGQPLAILAVMALKFIPDFPLVPEPEGASEYSGSGRMGFLREEELPQE